MRDSGHGADAAAFDAASGTDASPPGDAADNGDGTPIRLPCTDQFGNALTSTFGRLDGILVSIVMPGGSHCNSDASHVHLQVRANGAVYDVAVNVGSGGQQDVHTTTRDIALVGPAWSEGWHTNISDSYVTLGVHSSDIPLQTAAEIIAALQSDLATANHITIFGTGYGPDGAHLIHYNGSGHDGLIVTKPLSTTTHARLFSFTSQSF